MKLRLTPTAEDQLEHLRLTDEKKHKKALKTLAYLETKTTLSSKGQVVIPEEMQARLGLKTGAQFVVLGDKDVVIFKVLQPPAARDFAALVQEARQTAKRSGMRRGDITKVVARVRRQGPSSTQK